jgi:hypothetical protein
MTSTTQHDSSPKPRRRAVSIAIGALAVLGLALSASASGGLGGLASEPEGTFCHATRDCVYPKTPDTRIESGPLGYTDNPRPHFEFASNESHVTFECRMDDHSFHACPKEYQSDFLGDGEHRLDVRAVDEHGNVDPTPASLEFRVDTRCPHTEIVDHPSRVVHGRDARFALASTDRHARFHSWLDGKRLRGSSSNLKLRGLKTGWHTLTARAVDSAGNTDRSGAKFHFKVDAGHRHGHHGGHRHH